MAAAAASAIPVLMIAGVMKPNKVSKTAVKRKANDGRAQKAGPGKYLAGLKADLVAMDAFCQESKAFNAFNAVMNTANLDVESVITEIQQLLGAYPESQTVGIYYTGHGCEAHGEWAFADGNFSFKHLATIIRDRGNMVIFADSCFSGDWTQYLRQMTGQTKNVHIYAGSHPGKSALDADPKIKRGGLASLAWPKLLTKVFDDGLIDSADINAALEEAKDEVFGCAAYIDDNKQYHYHTFRDADTEQCIENDIKARKSINLKERSLSYDGEDVAFAKEQIKKEAAILETTAAKEKVTTTTDAKEMVTTVVTTAALDPDDDGDSGEHKFLDNDDDDEEDDEELKL